MFSDAQRIAAREAESGDADEGDQRKPVQGAGRPREAETGSRWLGTCGVAARTVGSRNIDQRLSPLLSRRRSPTRSIHDRLHGSLFRHTRPEPHQRPSSFLPPLIRAAMPAGQRRSGAKTGTALAVRRFPRNPTLRRTARFSTIA